MKLFEDAMRRGILAAQNNREALRTLFSETLPSADAGNGGPDRTLSAPVSGPAGAEGFSAALPPELISERFEQDARRYPRPLNDDWREA